MTRVLYLLVTLSIQGVIWAQTVVIDSTIATPTQAVIHVRVTNADGTPYTNSCSYRVSEGAAFSALVNDVNPALFAGANSDARTGSLINGRDHIFVAGTRIAAAGSDGKFYSRALQAATQHWVGVTCGSAAEVSTTFNTQNPPIGNTYPELPAFNPAAFGNAAFPTVDFSTRNSAYIDPMSGLQIKLLSIPNDTVVDNFANSTFTFTRDINSAWTNVANATANHNSSALANISAPNAPLFLSWDYLFDSQMSWDLEASVYDIKLRTYGSGANGAIIEACISIDGGQTCATGTLDFTLPTSVGEVSAPANYPTATFAGWNPHAILSGPVISNGGAFTVNVSGHTVTWVSETRDMWFGTSNNQFYVTRPPGTKLSIAGTSPACANNLCTVVSYDSPTQITIAENVATPVDDATMRDHSAGLLVWLKNTGGSPSAAVSFTYDYVNSEQQLSSVNAAYDVCGLPITDIATDKNGVPYPNGPKTGFLCSPSNILFLWIPELGEARLMSVYQFTGGNKFLPPSSPFSGTDPKTVFVKDVQMGHLWKGVLNGQNGFYPEYVPGNQYPASYPDNLTWTDLTESTATIDQDVQAMTGTTVAQASASGLMPAYTFWSIVSGSPTYLSLSSPDSPCTVARASSVDNHVIQAFTSWDHYPLRWGGCHFGPSWVGSYMFVTVNPIDKRTTTVPFGGPWTLNITQMKFGSTWRSYSQSITAGTNGATVQLTAVNNGFGLSSYAAYLWGPTITISGATGAWSAINGVHKVSPVNANTFNLPGIDSTNFGPFPAGVTFSAGPPMIHSHIDSVVGNPAVVTIDDPYAPIQDHQFQNGDAIGFGFLNQNTQYYAKRLTPTTFSVFSDAALTQPVDASALNGVNGGYVYHAETCPSNVPAEFTTNMRYDTGAYGVRCVTIRVAGEPCSDFPATGEQAKYPCKSDPANPNRSGLQDLEVGDFIADIDDNNYRESFVVLEKTKNSESDIELTLMRWWGNLVTADTHTSNPYHGSHQVGWTPLMIPSYLDPSEFTWIDQNDSTATALVVDPRYTGAHYDFGEGSAPGLYTFSNGYPDPFMDKTPAQILALPLTFTADKNPIWAYSPAGQVGYGSIIQSYPSHRQNGAPGLEQMWMGDWRAYLPDFGAAQATGAGFQPAVTLTNIRGTANDPSSATSIVYKISNMAIAFDRKHTPYYGWAGANMLYDISGPGSLIADSTTYAFCVADNAGECRPNSAVNDTFISLPTANTTMGHCWSDSYNVVAPCFTGSNPLGGWATQQVINPIDTQGARIRKLTTGLAAPGTHWTFMDWLQTPWVQNQPNWGFFVGPYVNGLWNRYFAVKLPPWPGQATGRDDWSVNRSTFVNEKITLGPNAAFPYARARFGYAENGPPSNFYCTARQEGCSTEIPVNTPSDPYSFAGENVTHMQCGSGCTINIPAIPGRVLYYVIDRFDGAGNIVTSPMQAVARP